MYLHFFGITLIIKLSKIKICANVSYLAPRYVGRLQNKIRELQRIWKQPLMTRQKMNHTYLKRVIMADRKLKF
jgi:hypothetical protein